MIDLVSQWVMDFQWLGLRSNVWIWLSFVSLTLFFASIIGMPYLVAGIPDDYFNYQKRPNKNNKMPALAIIVGFKILKNALAVFLILAGIIMLLIPGQGILTITMGILLLDYPGKYRFEKWLIAKPWVLKAVNWARRKHNKKEFIF